MTTTIKEEAQELLDSRLAVYGERVTNMERVAQVFSGILGTEVRPDQVPLLMVGYKTVRASQTPDYEDNIKDIEGYGLMFREIIGDNMISAVNTDEYIREKSRREAMKIAEMVDPPEPVFTCSGCGRTLVFAARPHAHAADCKVAELNRHVISYNSRCDDLAEEITAERAAQLQQEVPSFQPGPYQENAPAQHMEAYRKQLSDIFQRAWKETGNSYPVKAFADSAAREAVEYFWLTFKRNEQLQQSIRELKTL
jgi:hypothetical protein